MLDKKIEIKVGGDFDPVPADKYTVLIVDVNLVSQHNKWKGTEVDMLNYQFIVLDDKEMPESDGEKESTRGRFLWHRISPVINDRSWLGKFLKAVYGRDLTKEEKEEFDPESIIGKQVSVMTEQNESGDRVFTNIISYTKCTKKLKPVEFESNAGAVVEKSSVPATAPESADDVLDELESDSEVEKIEAKLVAAKKKAAKAKKADSKK